MANAARRLAIASVSALLLPACIIVPPSGTGSGLCDGCCMDAASDCSASEVCRFAEAELDDPNAPGACVDADGIIYLLSVSKLAVCERMPNGDEWDLGAGAPDPFIEFVVSGTSTAVSDTQDDSYNAFSDGVLAELTLKTTDTVTVNVWDEDISSHDPIGGFCLGPACDGPIGIDTLRGENAEGVDLGGCSQSGIASFDYVIVPKPN